MTDRRQKPVRVIPLLLLSLLACGTLSALAAGSAGEVVKVVGRVSAAAPDGEIRVLADASPVNSGDIIVTSLNSFARMKFSDGGYVVLRPNTRFEIADYHYAEKPTESRSLFNLLKGGFRAVTGLIGKGNRAGVSYRTAVATIGIRGTDLEAIDCTDGCPDLGTDVEPGVYFTVHQGSIDVNGINGDLQNFNQGLSGIARIDGKIGPDQNFNWAKYGCPDCGGN
jgi:hypothetical protein